MHRRTLIQSLLASVSLQGSRLRAQTPSFPGKHESTLKELAATHAAYTESQASNAHLAEEIEALRTERHQVRTRIEKLLGHIDQLTA